MDGLNVVKVVGEQCRISPNLGVCYTEAMRMSPILHKARPLYIAFVMIMFCMAPVHAQIQDWGSTPGQDNYCVVDGVPTLKCLEIVYGNLLYVSSAVILLVLFIMIVYGGYTFLTSMGESSKVQKGQKVLTWALIGIAVYAASYIILLVIDVAFMGGEGKIFRFELPGP